MYSISSQIFEGMTEYIIKSSNQKIQEKTQQKGEFFSGQVLADIVEKQKDEAEKKFLHDYSYTLFEEKLLENDSVLEISSDNVKSQIIEVEKFRFVKITSRVAFNDTKIIVDTIEKFNELGLALAFLTGGGSMLPDLDQINEKVESIKDRNEKSKAKHLVKSTLPNLKAIAAEKNLYLNTEYLEKLKFIINYGYHDQFEIAMPFPLNDKHVLFSAILKREKLKETEVDIIKKHGRLSEKDFTLFGILTQTKNIKDELLLYRDRNLEGNTTMKETIMNLIFHLTNVESVFSGKLDYEYVIDPIAIYQEI